MPATEWGWLITPDELQSWILLDTPEILVVNKPPHVVCHRSRFGPWSSLIGAAREHLGLERLHMPFRLDRETTGVMLFAKDKWTGRRLQHAVLNRQVSKEYVAIVDGRLAEAVTVDIPIGPDEHSEFFSRQAPRPDVGLAAVTHLQPMEYAPGHTMVRALPETGRRHQIRVHLSSLGLPIVGDKLYGRDPGLMLEFMRTGFAESMLAGMPIRRCALHCSRITFRIDDAEEAYEAPLPEDMTSLWRSLRPSVG